MTNEKKVLTAQKLIRKYRKVQQKLWDAGGDGVAPDIHWLVKQIEMTIEK